MNQNNITKQKLKKTRKIYENGLVKSSSLKKFKYVNRSLYSKQFLNSKSMAEMFAEQFDTAFTKESYPSLP